MYRYSPYGRDKARKGEGWHKRGWRDFDGSIDGGECCLLAQVLWVAYINGAATRDGRSPAQGGGADPVRRR